MWTLVGVVLGAVALLALLFVQNAAARRRCAERDRSTLHVALVLNRQDEGMRLLAANTARPEPWWTSTPPDQLETIDDALTDWGTVAGYVAKDRVDLDVILHAFGRRIVTMWESAYTYIEDRHPRLWEPLLDLYVDAWEAGHGSRARFEETPEDGVAVTPDDVPDVEELPADLLAPLLPTAPVTAAAAPTPVEPRLVVASADPAVANGHDARPERLADIQAALQPIPVVDVAPAAGRRSVVAAEVDAPAELLIDLIGTTSSNGAHGPLPRAVHR